MAELRLTHVSINAVDLEESARFYEQLFEMTRLPSPNFGEPVLWLAIDDQQLHLFGRPTTAPDFHHFGVSLSPQHFGRVYAEAKARGIIEGPFGAPLRRHPAGWVQTWLRDPSGNLVEVDCRDASALDDTVVEDLAEFEDAFAQHDEQRTASLFT
jgi:lactoylglutathione lyase